MRFSFSSSIWEIGLLNEFEPSEPEIGISRIVWRKIVWNKTESKILSWWIHQLRNFCQQEWRPKRVLWYTTEVTKLLLFVGFSRFDHQNSPFEVPCTIYLSAMIRFCCLKCRTKRVLGYTTEVGKLLLFVSLSRIKRQNSPFEVPCTIFYASSTDSVERNGVQNAFLGTP